MRIKKPITAKTMTNTNDKMDFIAFDLAHQRSEAVVAL